MKLIDIKRFKAEREELKKQWDSKTPFRYLVIENFLIPEKAEEVLNDYPPVDRGTWDGTTYPLTMIGWILLSRESLPILFTVIMYL